MFESKLQNNKTFENVNKVFTPFLESKQSLSLTDLMFQSKENSAKKLISKDIKTEYIRPFTAIEQKKRINNT